MKKLVSSILAVLMLLSCLSVLAGAVEYVNDESYILGDADGNKTVDARDAYAMRESVCNGTEISQGADINADGKTGAKDIYYIKAYFAENISLDDFENSYQVYRFVIGGNDIADFHIELPENCTSADNAHYAAEELQKYVKTATGTALELVYGTKEGPAIVFNMVDYYSEAGEELGIEGYKYEVIDGDLNIYGTYRGNMYAVYEIIENYLGFRFITDEETFVYKSRCVEIPEGTKQFVIPKIPIRNCRANFGNTTEHYFPMRLNFTGNGYTEPRYGLRSGTQFINAHSFGYYYRMGTGTMPDEAFGTLEERYAEKYNSGIQKDEYSWQPCCSTDEEYNILMEGMLDTIRMIIAWGEKSWGTYDFSPERLALGINSMGFSGCDNTSFCSCRICKAKAYGSRIKANEEVRSYVREYYRGGYTIDGNYIQFEKEYYSGLYIDYANRAATDIQEYYPNLRVHSILYDHNVPATVRPVKWLNVWYCGTGCNNHWLGSGECSEEGGQLAYADGSGKQSNRLDEKSLPAWGKFCDEAGAQLWFWYYPVTYHYYLCGCPNIFNIYYDYKFLYEECSVDCVFFEAGGQTYNFEELKSYLAAKMAWEPDMSFDRYCGYIKEYLYMYYGEGYEAMYRYLEMQNTAGDECGTCFINNYDRPGDMYSLEYIAEHYDEMRNLLITAENATDRSICKTRIETMRYCFDFLGLSAVYDSWYTNGSAATKAKYIERYDAMFDYFTEINIRIFSDSSIYSLPTEKDYTQQPMTQFYEDGSRRPDSAWG